MAKSLPTESLRPDERPLFDPYPRGVTIGELVALIDKYRELEAAATEPGEDGKQRGKEFGAFSSLRLFREIDRLP